MHAGIKQSFINTSVTLVIRGIKYYNMLPLNHLKFHTSDQTIPVSKIQVPKNFPKTIVHYIIIRVRSAFSLVASCVLLKYTRTDDVN